ncbi:MAG TPA: NAD(P)-binding protein [Steroidobacteraceae bacterium]|jgi:spermidine dehydrogenase|nr:NAD(P)-binding protein [Steroidobacteraceae bacterium]
MKDRRPRQELQALGADAAITRRDFVNGALAGAGASLLGVPAVAGARDGRPAAGADTFTGYGGVGDYADCNGNTWAVVQAAHRGIRDGGYDAKALDGARSAGDFDLVIVGGGIAALSAAHSFAKAAGAGRHALILENHPVFGGEARQNEFRVDGERLLGPQGSNDYLVPEKGDGSVADSFFEEFALPRAYDWQTWDPVLKPIRFPRDNASNWDGFQETQFDIGYFFAEGAGGKPRWLRNIWANGLADTPFTPAARRDLLRWRSATQPLTEGERRHLDSMSYQDYLERVCGYDPAVTRFTAPFVGELCGVSPDAVSGLVGRELVERPDIPMSFSFPGGNSPFARVLLRALVPDALPGRDFGSLMYGPIHFPSLDREGQATRVRLAATVLRVKHLGTAQDRLEITYEKGGELLKVSARSVVMASGGWVNKHILVDMPQDLRAAYEQFVYAPAMIVNVALRQWRFLYDLGVAACRWFDDRDSFGWTCNIRQLMVTERHAPALHPDRPAVLTFYMGFPTPGLPAAAQGAAARARLLATPYADFELRIRRQLVRLFGSHGFKPQRDIAGVILNRWGHARLVQPPGFLYGRDGKPSPLQRAREGYGRVSIGHAELNGSQTWDSAVKYGRLAGERAASFV